MWENFWEWCSERRGWLLFSAGALLMGICAAEVAFAGVVHPAGFAIGRVMIVMSAFNKE